MKICNLYLQIFALFLILQIAYGIPQWHNGTDGRRYLIEDDYKFNWYQASNVCARRHLQLVEIYTESKSNAITELLNKVFDGKRVNLWIGGNDAFGPEQYRTRPFFWFSSGKKFTFTNWATFQPDNKHYNEHCAHIWDWTFYQWNDNPCDTTKIGYICEEDPLKELIRLVKTTMKA